MRGKMRSLSSSRVQIFNGDKGDNGSCLYSFRTQYFNLIEECVCQIVLHKSGADPDFTATKRFEIDVENLIGNLGILISQLKVQNNPF
jgi:hypothetical protein